MRHGNLFFFHRDGTPQSTQGQPTLAAQHRERLFRQAQGIETLGVHPEAALGNELAKNGAPLGGGVLRAGAEHFQPVVAPVADACIVLTDENLDQVVHAEAFAGAGDAGHGLLRSLGAVPGLRRVHAVVAIAAVLLPALRQSRREWRGGGRW